MNRVTFYYYGRLAGVIALAEKAEKMSALRERVESGKDR